MWQPGLNSLLGERYVSLLGALKMPAKSTVNNASDVRWLEHGDPSRLSVEQQTDQT
jgi:hypothetical protein